MSSPSHANIHLPLDAIAAFCQHWGVRELALFGSVLRPDFSDVSDVDVLVQFDDTMQHTLFDLARMGEELEALLQRPVDLLDRQAVEASPNYIRRDSILRSAEVVYAS
jgi:predicted nucleotidyltransferase